MNTLTLNNHKLLTGANSEDNKRLIITIIIKLEQLTLRT